MFPNTNACREMNSMHKLRILILYPDPAGLALLTSMLKSLGHIIEEATNDRARGPADGAEQHRSGARPELIRSTPRRSSC